MFTSKTISYLIILLYLLVGTITVHAQVLVVGDSSVTKVDTLTYETDDVVVTATWGLAVFKITTWKNK